MSLLQVSRLFGRICPVSGFTVNLAIRDFVLYLSLKVTDGFTVQWFKHQMVLDVEEQLLYRTFLEPSEPLNYSSAPCATGTLKVKRAYQTSSSQVPKVLKFFLVAFIMDGGPKVSSCVFNGRLWNQAPAGWKFFPKNFGEIGGNNLTIDGTGIVKKFKIYDRALMTNECHDACKK